MERDWVRGKCIGKGSFGTVSLAQDKLEGRIFAVKSVPLNSDSIESLENEIEILRSLNSSYIVAYLGDSTTNEWRNLHMEHVPGGTLADAAGRLGEHEVRAYTRCIVQALSYLHSVAGVVHSDVKGRNVLLGSAPPGVAKLADFGSARRISDGRPAIGGTPLWMAPEVVRGSQPTPESDIWSLGCTMVEMVTGGHPWSSSAVHDHKLFEIGFGHGLPEFPDQLSKSGTDFLSKCLRRDPAERWTAEQLLRHPFLADTAAAAGSGTGWSPRSVFDWFGSEFDEAEDSDGENDDHDDDDAMGMVRERIRQLAGGNESRDLDWDSEGWQVVRYFDGGEEENREGLGDFDEETGACASGWCCSNCRSSCSHQVGRVVRKERCLDLYGVLVRVMLCYLVNANPVSVDLVFLQLFRLLYRFDELRFLRL